MGGFVQPQAGDLFQAKEHEGKLCLFENVGPIESITTSFGPADIVRANVTVFDPQTGVGEEYAQSMVFGRALVGTVNRSAQGGQAVLGRLGKSATAKAGQSPAWVLTEFSPADAAHAQAYVDRRAQGAFSQPAAQQQQAPQYQPAPAQQPPQQPPGFPPPPAYPAAGAAPAYPAAPVPAQAPVSPWGAPPAAPVAAPAAPAAPVLPPGFQMPPGMDINQVNALLASMGAQQVNPTPPPF